MSLASKLREYRRVISISRKPSREEFSSIMKIAGIGVILMGAIGFIIQVFYQLIRGGI